MREFEGFFFLAISETQAATGVVAFTPNALAAVGLVLWDAGQLASGVGVATVL